MNQSRQLIQSVDYGSHLRDSRSSSQEVIFRCKGFIFHMQMTEGDISVRELFPIEKGISSFLRRGPPFSASLSL